MSERIGVIRRVLLPADDLSLEFERAGYYGLGDDIKLGLSLIYGIGPNQPRLIAVDDAGRLVLAPVSGGGAGVTLLDGGGALGAQVFQQSFDGSAATSRGVLAQATLYGFNGVSLDRVRTGSAAVLGAHGGVGSVVTVPPGSWTGVHTPAAGTQATITNANAGAGVRHVATGIVVTFGAIAAPVATPLTWNLRDGASGLGTILASGQIAVPAAVFQGQPIVLSGLCIPGTANTSMTLEFSAALANLLEGVTLTGFDTN